jgi:hypothetical protein
MDRSKGSGRATSVSMENTGGRLFSIFHNLFGFIFEILGVLHLDKILFDECEQRSCLCDTASAMSRGDRIALAPGQFRSGGVPGGLIGKN